MSAIPSTPLRGRANSNSHEDTIKSAMSFDNILSSPPQPARQTPKSPATPAALPALPMTPQAQVPKTDAPTPSTTATTFTPGPSSSTAMRDSSPGATSTLSSSPDPDALDRDAYAHREFDCMNDEYSECKTGQYSLKLSRKVISNHFGRNKACTRLIKDWPLFCRKHYQRATYKPDLWQRRKVALILRQFGIIEEQFPGTTYHVSLKKSEMDRLNTFARAMDSGMTPQQAGALVAPDKSIKSFQAPIDILRELQHELGRGKTVEEVKHVLSLINTMLREGECVEVPSIEFLPEIPKAEKEKVKTPKGKTPEGKGRISSKGGIQKTAK